MSMLHIVGGGAIGSLLSTGAHKHNVPYAQYPRNALSCPTRAQWLDDRELLLNSPIMSPRKLNKDDTLVFPLKVYQLSDAITSWLPYLKNTPTVVLLHNGMGGHEIARALLPENYPLLLATTSHGALKQRDTSGNVIVKYTGVGTTQIGNPNTSTPNALQLTNTIRLLSAVLPPVDEREDILCALWAKLVVNAVINPLTALHNIQNKYVTDPQFEESRVAVCNEFILVASAYGFHFELESVHNNVLTVASATGENFSSMHQDVAHNRQTEIDAINGYLVEMAKKKGIDVPANTLLVNRIKALRN